MPLATTLPAARRPRARRIEERLHRAANFARTRRQSAFAVALAQIGAAFDAAAVINDFKLQVERIIRLRPQHPAVRARFAARAAMLSGRGLDGAVILVDRWWRDERKAFQVASAFGRGSRLSLDVLGELRLILRWLRFKQMQAEYQAALEALREPPLAEAAE
jgi:hypothetical protein